MAATRAFYVVQGRLSVCSADGVIGDDSLSFPDSDAGIRAFGEYLAASAAEHSIVLIDVIEEVFATDAIPKLSALDRKALFERRIKRKFPRTPYRLAVPGDVVRGDKAERTAVYSSISNHELLDPWISAILRHRVPLSGIYSIPWMAPRLVKSFYRLSKSVLFITQHQTDKLRLCFVQGGLVKSARLSQSPAQQDESYAAFVNTEILRSRRYLERSRLLNRMEELDVCMIVDAVIAEELVSIAQDNMAINFHFVDPARASKRLHVRGDVPPDKLEGLFIATALLRRPQHSYAVSGEQRYRTMSLIRRAIIGGAIAVGAACTVAAGIYIGDAWRLSRESSTFDSLVTQLSETYRRENEDLGPIKADSYEMKLAVDTGDYILQQRVPVPWVMQQLGSVLGDYPDVRIQQLTWQAETDAVPKPARSRPGEPAAAIAIPALNSVSAVISASIEPFDGDLRSAFARIDQLAADIASRTSFVDAEAVEYPVDARPEASISGDIDKERLTDPASFRLRLEYPLTAPNADQGRSDDESA